MVQKLYNLSSDKYTWNSYKVTNRFREDAKEKLYNFIQEIDENINEDDINKLSKKCSDESEKIKIKFPIIPSIFAALFISLWNNFINWIYKSKRTIIPWI